MSEAIRHKAMYSTDRHFKVGDVLRMVSHYTTWKEVEEKGLAVVIQSSGPMFTVYWLGDETTSKHDARWGGFNLQDLAPMPDVAKHVETMIQMEYI